MFNRKINKCPRCTMRKKCVWHKNVLGFNLIELIIVVAVAAILMAAIFLNEDPLARVGKAKDAERLQEVESIAKALELYSLDNVGVPGDFASSTIAAGETYVLCSQSATVTCGSQTRPCLVIDDPNYLKFLNSLPVDPDKTSAADTGYYITRTASGAIEVGACDTYDPDVNISVVSKAKFPVCGNGIVDPGEVCDDGNTLKEGCGDGILQNGTYCKGCYQVLNLAEVCDYNAWTQDCYSGGKWYTYSDYGQGDACNNTCTQATTDCPVPQNPEP